MMTNVLRRILGFCVVYALVTMVVLIISIVIEFLDNENLTFSFCVTTQCVAVVNEHFKETLSLFKSIAYMIVPLAGLSGALVGLSNYSLAVSNSVMNNHISNFKLFCEYVDRELGKKDLIDSEAIDYFLMYSLIFPESKKGNFNNFDKYNEKVANINKVIRNSNAHYGAQSSTVSTTTPPFNYSYHQHAMKNALAEIGIVISINHRNAFNEVEEQVLDFLYSVSKVFVDSECIVKVDKDNRKYI
ncbi:hypothetical protein HJ160_03775 [Vibrio parahaemolyticus]|nr:hypothetical protein [Vibrio parahaemolyticus]